MEWGLFVSCSAAEADIFLERSQVRHAHINLHKIIFNVYCLSSIFQPADEKEVSLRVLSNALEDLM